MKKDYEIVNIISTNVETELKEKINGIVRTLCIENIEKMSNMDYNMDVTYFDGTSEISEREVSDCC